MIGNDSNFSCWSPVVESTHVADSLGTRLRLAEPVCLTLSGKMMTYTLIMINSYLSIARPVCGPDSKSPRKMQACNDLQPFFGLVASSVDRVERSRPGNTLKSSRIPCFDESSFEEEDQGSSPTSKVAPCTIPNAKNRSARKCQLSECSRDFGTFRMITDSCQT